MADDIPTPPDNEFSPNEMPDPDRPGLGGKLPETIAYATPGQATPPRHDPYVALRYPDAQLSYWQFPHHPWHADAHRAGLRTLSMHPLLLRVGLVGLVQAIPIILLVMPAGHLADVANRKAIIFVTQAIIAICSVALAAVSFFERVPDLAILRTANGWLLATDVALAGIVGKTSHAQFTSPAIPLFFFILLLIGIARAFNDPAKSSLLPPGTTGTHGQRDHLE